MSLALAINVTRCFPEPRLPRLPTPASALLSCHRVSRGWGARARGEAPQPAGCFSAQQQQQRRGSFWGVDCWGRGDVTHVLPSAVLAGQAPEGRTPGERGFPGG